MKNTILVLVLWMSCLVASAQNENDALRYSLTGYMGTARFMSMGGAFGAIGADFSTLAQNPAGIGLYRRSEISVTPGLFSGGAKATYYGTNRTDSKLGLNLLSAGGIYVMNFGESKSPVKFVQFGVGIIRQADYNSRITVSGLNPTSSLMTQYENEANLQNVAPDKLDAFSVKLAYDANLLFDNFNPTTNKYSYQCDMYSGNVQQRKVIETSGNRSEFVLSGGANINEKLFIGGTLGLPTFSYEESSVYTETDSQNVSPVFASLTRREYLKTTGSGMNFKVGAIFRPSNNLRFGLAVHTPTIYTRMEDQWHSSISSTFEGAHPEWGKSAYSPDGSYNYKLNTPFKVMGSVAIIAGKSGLVSADYEYIDYRKASLSSSDYDFDTENNAIQNKFKAAHNFRLGGELNYSIMSFRAGVFYYGSPYVSNVSDKGAQTGISLGFGMQQKNYFVNFAYTYSSLKQDMYLYNPKLTKASENQNLNSQIAVTLGFKY